jgi:hypothetical protein
MVFDIDEMDSHPTPNTSKKKPKKSMLQSVKKFLADRSKRQEHPESNKFMVTDAISNVRVK